MYGNLRHYVTKNILDIQNLQIMVRLSIFFALFILFGLFCNVNVTY